MLKCFQCSEKIRKNAAKSLQEASHVHMPDIPQEDFTAFLAMTATNLISK
jgi:hypothetical protein